MKTKFFVDFDSTIVDSIKAYCDTYNVLYSAYKDFKPADYTKTRVWSLKDECPLVEDAEDIFGEDLFFIMLECFPDAYRVLEQLSTEYDIIICTIGNHDNVSKKVQWIKQNLPFIKKILPIVNVDVDMDKSVANMEGAIFIDDIKKNLDSTNAEVKICFGDKKPWNETWDGLWFDSWLDVEDMLTDLT